MIWMMCGVRLVDKVSTDVLQDRRAVVVKIKDVIMQSRLRWYGHLLKHQLPNVRLWSLK